MRCCPRLLLQVLALASEKGKGGQEIPIPVVTEVASYSRDYLPTYRERPVYVRGRGEQLMSGCTGMGVACIALHCICKRILQKHVAQIAL